MSEKSSSTLQPHHAVFVLLSFVFLGLFVAAGVLYGLGKVQGINFFDPNSIKDPSTNIIVTQLVTQGVFLFIIPALLTMYFFPSLRLKRYLSFEGINKGVVVKVVLLFVVSLPLVGFLGWVNAQIPLSDGLDSMETNTNDLIRSLISGTSMPLLVFLMGVLPALGEELFFRGALQKGLENWTNSPHFAIIFTAFIFSAFHMQFAGFLPRFFLGFVLGYAYYFSGSLWIPIILHFVFNASQAVMMKVSPELIEEFGKIDQIEMPSLWMVLLSLAGFIYLFYLLVQKDRIPVA